MKMVRLELGTLWFRVPKCRKMNVTNHFTMQPFGWLVPIRYPVPIGNFFSKRELFYLTHIHDHRAKLQSSDFGAKTRFFGDKYRHKIPSYITDS